VHAENNKHMQCVWEHKPAAETDRRCSSAAMGGGRPGPILPDGKPPALQQQRQRRRAALPAAPFSWHPHAWRPAGLPDLALLIRRAAPADRQAKGAQVGRCKQALQGAHPARLRRPCAAAQPTHGPRARRGTALAGAGP